MIWTSKFWQATADRALRTAAQATIASIGSVTINMVDWEVATIFTATMVILSVCNSIIKPPAEAQ